MDLSKNDGKYIRLKEIGEIKPHGTAELRTERLVLRRYTMEDAEELHHYLGSDPAMSQYSGWNPYETLEMARETVRRGEHCIAASARKIRYEPCRH